MYVWCHTKMADCKECRRKSSVWMRSWSITEQSSGTRAARNIRTYVCMSNKRLFCSLHFRNSVLLLLVDSHLTFDCISLSRHPRPQKTTCLKKVEATTKVLRNVKHVEEKCYYMYMGIRTHVGWPVHFLHTPCACTRTYVTSIDMCVCMPVSKN